MAATKSGDQDAELSKDVFQSVVVHNSGGSLRITVPSEIVDQLDIEPGDRLVYHGSEGDCKVSIGRVGDVV
jgi:bifunctional DNA-binding transcriptional regulator/antitoxin component of YhaV-PrlF toxin-antitoxin module